MPSPKYPPAPRTARFLPRLLSFALYLTEALLIFRVLLGLLSASPAAPFTRVVYRASAPLVAPFRGVFPDLMLRHLQLESSALLAMLVYYVLAEALLHFLLLARRK